MVKKRPVMFDGLDVSSDEETPRPHGNNLVGSQHMIGWQQAVCGQAPLDHAEAASKSVSVEFDERRDERAGVYFLIDDDEIVYIGQSGDCLSRVKRHWKEKKKEFDSYVLLPIEGNVDDRRTIEAALIQFLTPHYQESAHEMGRDFALDEAPLIRQYCGDEVLNSLSGLDL